MVSEVSPGLNVTGDDAAEAALATPMELTDIIIAMERIIKSFFKFNLPFNCFYRKKINLSTYKIYYKSVRINSIFLHKSKLFVIYVDNVNTGIISCKMEINY
ncbi:hypothetical protein D1B31_18405 [Neobacillus notoginsengisoli]|uniref:Uncharacterized protein n=1 Tax=Neobacillus notoginsengisoli TaxID=1578198 RepID=A0A417YPX8_9BACI|nr:hypothetical protein D1B31_18405 [Neobacillus notoginsengisoli]